MAFDQISFEEALLQDDWIPRMGRRRFLKAAAIAGGAMVTTSWWRTNNALAATMAKFPEKTDLILLTDRPPCLETPLKYFREDLTPNDAFFVRWHLSGIPTSVDLSTFRLSVGGNVSSPLELSVDDLKKNFPATSVVAVAQCSGNSRSHFKPMVGGGEWDNGAMGCAKWTGVKLSDLLKKAGAKDNTVEVSFAGLDEAPWPDTPKFAKSLEYKKATDGEVMVAYAMNDQPLPMLNGFPLRLVVPGWYATYWVKSLNKIDVLPEKFKSFWMDKAYRIPNNPTGNEDPKKLATDTVPISKHSVRSIFVNPEPGQRVKAGAAMELEGIAFDYGAGIKQVEVSTDGGKNWSPAKLDPEISKFAFRRFRMPWTPSAKGKAQLMCRATNNDGVGQTTSLWNRSGYMWNVIEPVDVSVV
jgi:DMSO/TMAO reductase YedYZ molybdopterin-dependent catalytic subunit